MELGRAAYTANVRFYNDDARTTKIRWYRVPADRPVFPYPHLFNSANWDEDNEDPRSGYVKGTLFGLGEQMDNDRPYDGGAERAAPPRGDHVCGDREAWTGGLLMEHDGLGVLNPMGWLRCCQPRQEDGLQVWLDANDVRGGDFDPVVKWPDRSLERNDADQTDPLQQPFLITSGDGGNSVVFSGTLTNMLLTRPLTGGSFTMFAVLSYLAPQLPPVAALKVRLGMPFGNTVLPAAGFVTTYTSVAIPRYDFRTRIAGVSRGGAVNFSSRFLWSVLHDKDAGFVRSRIVDENGLTVLDSTQLVTWPAFSMNAVGYGGVPIRPLGVALGECMFFSRVLANDEYQAVSDQLSRKWAFPLP